ncbi:MAG: hypothetical protein LBN11_01820 [Tannerella sp.]|nr:hypothetical protein [Tannerella sp.]
MLRFRTSYRDLLATIMLLLMLLQVVFLAKVVVKEDARTHVVVAAVQVVPMLLVKNFV